MSRLSSLKVAVAGLFYSAVISTAFAVDTRAAVAVDRAAVRAASVEAPVMSRVFPDAAYRAATIYARPVVAADHVTAVAADRVIVSGAYAAIAADRAIAVVADGVADGHVAAVAGQTVASRAYAIVAAGGAINAGVIVTADQALAAAVDGTIIDAHIAA